MFLILTYFTHPHAGSFENKGSKEDTNKAYCSLLSRFPITWLLPGKAFQELLEVESKQTREVSICERNMQILPFSGRPLPEAWSRSTNSVTLLPDWVPTSGSGFWTRMCKQEHLPEGRFRGLWISSAAHSPRRAGGTSQASGQGQKASWTFQGLRGLFLLSF